jgi:2-polyprenyl-3-methyl-5-hydroxy-6-metoxy-1,4-benzoquinol methylase
MRYNLFADSKSSGSLGNQFRKKRFAFFKKQIDSLAKPLNILDVGGDESYWVNRGLGNNEHFQITILNLEKKKTSSKNITSISGNATNLYEIKNNQFDICFSNSVIEHLHTHEKQVKMAEETQRVGKYHFIQTPNRNFIIEPHYLLPFFQFIPKKIQYLILTKTKLSRMKKWKKDFAKNYVDEIRLLSLREMKELFPNSKFDLEKIFGLTKSFTAHNF